MTIGAVDICSTTPTYRGLSAVSRDLDETLWTPRKRLVRNDMAAGRRQEYEMSTDPSNAHLYAIVGPRPNLLLINISQHIVRT